jgi:hypothetical protein
MSRIYSVFHRHSDNNHGFMRALKNALSSLSGLLANKNDTLNTLRTIMKTLILPAKKMVLRLEWEDAVKPIIRHLREYLIVSSSAASSATCSAVCEASPSPPEAGWNKPCMPRLPCRVLCSVVCVSPLPGGGRGRGPGPAL